jgi:ABC-type bacteriocin/lantibiotic exporter with double-glycine peptidase domain
LPLFEELRLNYKYRKFIRRQKQFGDDNLGCCLAIIAKLKGDKFNLLTTLQLSSNEIDLENPSKRLDEMGFQYEILDISMESIGDMHLPSLILWNSKRFVVLVEKDYQGFTIIDPLQFPMRYYNDQFECQFCESLILINSFPNDTAS